MNCYMTKQEKEKRHQINVSKPKIGVSMFSKFKLIGLLVLLTMNSAFANVSQKDVIKGVFFGAGPVADKVDYINKSYSLKNKLNYEELKQAEILVEELSKRIIKKNPRFAKELTEAVNKKDMIEILHQLETADTVLTSFQQDFLGEANNEAGMTVAVAVVAVAAAAVHNVAAVTSMVVVAVAAAVKVALRTVDTEDSLMHRELLSMELVNGL